MIRITIQTRTVAAAEMLAAHLMDKHLLLFATMDTDHEGLTWKDGRLTRTEQFLLHGLTKALLYRELESSAMDLLGQDIVRMHAVPVTNIDPEAQQQLLQQTAKV